MCRVIQVEIQLLTYFILPQVFESWKPFSIHWLEWKFNMVALISVFKIFDIHNIKKYTEEVFMFYKMCITHGANLSLILDITFRNNNNIQYTTTKEEGRKACSKNLLLP